MSSGSFVQSNFDYPLTIVKIMERKRTLKGTFEIMMTLHASGLKYEIFMNAVVDTQNLEIPALAKS